MCLSTILEDIESSANDYVFSGLLADHDRIFPRLSKNQTLIRCDDLPEIWFEKDSLENQTIERHMAIRDIIFDHGYEL